MKLAINKITNKGQIVTDQQALSMSGTHRVVNAKLSHVDALGGAHYVDSWGGTWRVEEGCLANLGKTESTVGAMDKWS